MLLILDNVLSVAKNYKSDSMEYQCKTNRRLVSNLNNDNGQIATKNLLGVKVDTSEEIYF